jgi:hypothetical protein
MSRGHGFVQRKILALIAAEPNGAWSYGELCRIVYPGQAAAAAKAQLVAIGRALSRLTLPGTWALVWSDRKCWLCDPCNLMSMRIIYRGHSAHHFEPGGMYYEAVERAKRYRDGSALDRIDIQIENESKILGMIKMCGGSLVDARERIEHITKNASVSRAEREEGYPFSGAGA